MYDAALDADALILVTEWKEFRLPTWGVIKKAMKQPVVLDGRNIYDGDELQEMGFVYHCIGRINKIERITMYKRFSIIMLAVALSSCGTPATKRQSAFGREQGGKIFVGRYMVGR